METNNYTRLFKIKKILIQKHSSCFIIDDKFNILKIKKRIFTKNIFHFLFNQVDIDKMFYSEKKKKIKILSTTELIPKIIKKMPNSRGVHPFVFYLFYSELMEHGIEYKYLDSIDSFEIRSSTIKIREQIQETFKIVDKIFADNALKNISPSLFNSLLGKKGIQIEDKIKTGFNRVKHRYIDLVFNISEDSNVYIEINEYHHNKELDLERSVEIYLTNNTMPIMVYKEDLDLEDTLTKIWKEISYGLFKKNKSDSLIIYLNKVDHFDLAFSQFIVNIQVEFIEKNKSIPLDQIYKYFKMLKFKNFYNFVKNMIESDNLPKHYFNKIDLDNLNKSLINNNGLDTLLMLPRKEDWLRSSEIKKYYSQFKFNYMNIINQLMSSQFDRLDILKQSCKNYKNLSVLADSTFDIIQKLVIPYKNIINDELKIKIHPKIWCFKYEKGERIPFYELEKLFNKKTIEYIKLHNETKQNILHYKIIDREQINQMIDIILSSRDKEYVSENSDEEELLEF